MIRGEKPISMYCVKKTLNAETYSFGQRYQVIQRIGQGSFGDIYKAFDMQKKQLCAIKLQKKEGNQNSEMLTRQYSILKELKGWEGFPRVYDYKSTENHSFMVMSFLGPNLEMVKQKITDNQLSTQSSLQIAIQTILLLEKVHSRNYIHRDIKPENFVVGTDGQHHTVFILDFGLSKQYMNFNKHIPQTTNKGLVGTARYTSINSHNGLEQSRRDDLEALGYVLLYLTRGNLPWQNLQSDTRSQKFKKIFESKLKSQHQELCVGAPKCYKLFMDYVKGLKFEEAPNYNYLVGLFVEELKTELSASNETCYSWCPPECPLQKYPMESLPIEFIQSLTLSGNSIYKKYQLQENDATIIQNGNMEIQIKKLDFSNLQIAGSGGYAVPASTTSRRVYEEEDKDEVKPLQKSTTGNNYIVNNTNQNDNIKMVPSQMKTQNYDDQETNEWTSVIDEKPNIKMYNHMVEDGRLQSIHGGLVKKQLEKQ